MSCSPEMARSIVHLLYQDCHDQLDLVRTLKERKPVQPTQRVSSVPDPNRVKKERKPYEGPKPLKRGPRRPRLSDLQVQTIVEAIERAGDTVSHVAYAMFQKCNFIVYALHPQADMRRPMPTWVVRKLIKEFNLPEELYQSVLWDGFFPHTHDTRTKKE